MKFSSPLALGMWAAVPAAHDPIDAILWHARMLIIESGLSQPPFTPATYAPLRNVKSIVEKYMEVEGQLIPRGSGFTIELRKDRPQERKNFTCAHEIGHTFFYEAVPSVKYRTVTTQESRHDPEEEMLCNIAAAELLMPAEVFSKVASDYPQSPQSLQEIAGIFETSLTSTVVQLLRKQVWNCSVVLWEGDGDTLTASWVASPRRGLTHYPRLEIDNVRSSGIYHSYSAGEATVSNEWLSFNGGFKHWSAHSIRLGANKVLTCLGLPTSENSRLMPKHSEPPEFLPLKYDCECGGTGWIWLEQNGRKCVMRCRATTHQSAQITNS